MGELATMMCVNPAHHDAVGLETVATAGHVHVCVVCVIWISVVCSSLRNIVVMFPALPRMMVWRACSAQLRAPVRNSLTHMYHISSRHYAINLTHYTSTLNCTCDHGKKYDLLVLVATRIMGVFWGSGLRVGVWLQSWFS